MERLFTLGLSNAMAATVLAVGVAALGRLLARRPAALHCLWFLVLLKLVTPPLFEVPIASPLVEVAKDEPMELALVEPVTEPGPEDVGTADPALAELLVREAPDRSRDELRDQEPFWTRLPATLVPWLGIAWLMGTGLILIVAAVRVARFRGLLREAYRAPDDVQALVEGLAARLDLRRSPQTWFIDSPLMPMLWAVGCRPRLIIPRDLWKSLSQRQRSLLLVHELAHLRRGDHLLRFFELLVTALYWWLPVVWWARHALRDAEEQCCDAWVIWAFPDEARTYAETLLDTVDFLNPSRATEPLLASGFGRTHHLRRRLTMIMLGTTPRRLGWASALGALALSAVLLPLTPSWAQKPQDKVEAHAFAIELRDDTDAKTGQAEKSQIEFVIASDGDVDKIKADSLDQAVALLKQRIEGMAKESGGSEKHASQIKALKQAIAELQNARKTEVTVKVDAPKGDESKIEQRLYVARLDKEVDSKLVAEKKAQLDKAKVRVDSLRKELAEKRHQLVDAERDLAKLTVATKALTLTLKTPKIVVDRMPEKLDLKAIVKTPSLEFHSSGESSSLSPSDRERLESLEKKLSKLLDEVASLKKHDK